METLHPVGTKVYSFRDHPYVILEGVIIEHRRDWYVCRWYDPILDFSYEGLSFGVFLTKEEADKAHTQICEILSRA